MSSITFQGIPSTPETALRSKTYRLDTTGYIGLNGKSASGKVYPNDTFNVDPEFVDASKNNFQLQAISPMIDAGYSVTNVQNDYAGVSRPQGKGIDIGPFEFVGSVSSLANTPTTIPVTSTNASTLVPTATQVPTATPTTGSNLCPDCGLADSPWPMLGGNTAHRSQSEFNGPNQATGKWTFSNGSSTNSSPVLDINNNRNCFRAGCKTKGGR